jgi:hypothetical protein
MGEALNKLIEAAKQHKTTVEEREEQRRSFAYGNTKIENSLITRKMVDEEAERLKK